VPFTPPTEMTCELADRANRETVRIASVTFMMTKNKVGLKLEGARGQCKG
jgi:hypothetical protein